MSPQEYQYLPPEDKERYEEVLDSWKDEDIAAYRDVIEANEDEQLLGGYVMVELDPLTAKELVDMAQGRGIDPGRLAGELLRRALMDGK